MDIGTGQMEHDVKVCSKCELEKDFDEFNADSRRKDGKRASCKTCDAAHKKRIRDSNIDEYRRKNREANRAFRSRQKFKDIDEE